MAALHLILVSNPAAWRDCLASMQAGDAILLLDAGVELLGDPQGIGRLVSVAGSALRASAPDVVARGLEALAQFHGVGLIEDADWVDTVRRCQPVLSWA